MNCQRGFSTDVLDTLGFWLGFRDAIPGELSLDTDLKAGLAFHSIQQRASEGTTVRVKVLLSRTLPVALRVPFTVGSSAAAYDHKSLSPSQKGGLLFLAGETSKEITFTLSEDRRQSARDRGTDPGSSLRNRATHL